MIKWNEEDYTMTLPEALDTILMIKKME